MTTPRKTTRKATPKGTTKLTGAEVSVRADEELLEEEKTAAEAEVDAEDQEDGEKKYPTFTVDINGVEITLEDRWHRDQPPGAMMFMGSDHYAEKYVPGLVDQLIGEDQIGKLLDAGADAYEIAGVTRAWAEARGLKN